MSLPPPQVLVPLLKLPKLNSELRRVQDCLENKDVQFYDVTANGKTWLWGEKEKKKSFTRIQGLISVSNWAWLGRH